MPVHDLAFVQDMIAVIQDLPTLHNDSVVSFAASMEIAQSLRSRLWQRRQRQNANANDTVGLIPEIVPATYEDIDDIFQYEEQEFAGHHATKARLLEWCSHDPSNFMCFKFAGESIMGYYILFFLTTQSMERFLSGELLEDDVRASDLIKPLADQYAVQGDAHICVFASKRQSSLFTVDLLWHLIGRILYLAEYGSLRKLYAEATTEEGERILRRFKFELYDLPGHKGDPLLQLNLNSATVRQMKEWYTNRSFCQRPMLHSRNACTFQSE